MTLWNDFNSADDQNSADLIPRGTLVKVRLTLRPGGFDDPAQGWNGGYATRNEQTGSVYLSGEFIVTEGKFARRKLWSLIGLHSAKGTEWADMGRSFIKAILNSSRGIHPGDNSPAAQSARCISGFADLDGIEFLARVDWEKDQEGQDKHLIKAAITPDHREYAAIMGQPGKSAQAAASPVAAGRPRWAQ